MENPLGKITLIILGRTGSGKGTQAEILKRKYGFYVIETGALVRSFCEMPTAFAKKIKVWSEAGNLVPWWLALYLWIKELIKLPEDANLIFDGAPRDLAQVRVFDEILEWFDRKHVLVIHLDVSAKETRQRLLLRKRADDSEESIARRFSVYEEFVTLVVRHYQEKNQLVNINGEQSVEDVAREIEKKLSERLEGLWPPP